MGTELYERGFYINRLFEELNASNPSDVQAVHKAYLAAGSQVITTNTFSMNRFVLEKFGIQTEQRKLLQAGVRLAREAAEEASIKGTRPQVALSFGPSGALMEPLGPLSRQEVRDEFAELARIHLELDPTFRADRYVLETFSNLDELEEAVLGIRSADPTTPVFISITLMDQDGVLDRVTQYADRFGKREDISGMGFNCSEGPAGLLEAVRILRPLTKHSILVEPNAGIPRQINGRYFYMTSPDYLAKYAKRFVEAGANAVGGCCGTGPDHIRAIADAVHMLQVKLETEVAHRFERIEMPTQREPSHSWSQRSKSKIGQLITSGKKVISVELQSPKGASIERFVADLKRLAAQGVTWVNVPDGARASTRVSSLHLAAHINQRTDIGIRILPHLTSRDRNLIALQADLLGASVNEVHDLLLITGDPPKLGVSKEATAVYDIDSIGLTYLAHRLNQGFNGSGEAIPQATEFGIGVAANPTSVNLALELERFKFKVESGADFAVTQPIFDPEAYFSWKEKSAHCPIPHIIGIWPFSSLRNAEFMAHEVPGVHVPDWALTRMAKWADDPVSASKEGIAIALESMQALKSHCDGFAISAPLGKIEPVLEILKS